MFLKCILKATSPSVLSLAVHQSGCHQPDVIHLNNVRVIQSGVQGPPRMAPSAPCTQTQGIRDFVNF